MIFPITRRATGNRARSSPFPCLSISTERKQPLRSMPLPLSKAGRTNWKKRKSRCITRENFPPRIFESYAPPLLFRSPRPRSGGILFVKNNAALRFPFSVSGRKNFLSPDYPTDALFTARASRIRLQKPFMSRLSPQTLPPLKRPLLHSVSRRKARKNSPAEK